MFVLTKRGISSHGDAWHRVYGLTPDPTVARAWYRATRVTDVFELEPREVRIFVGEDRNNAQDSQSIISDRRLESWREQQAREDLERAKQKGSPFI